MTNEKPPVNLFKQGLDKEAAPTLFRQPTAITTIPEAQYNSAAGSFALKSLNPKVQQDATRQTMDGITSQDGAQKKVQMDMAIKSSLQRQDGIPLPNKIKAAQTLLIGGVQPSTVGQSYKENVYPNAPDSRIGQSIDKKIVQDDAKANTLTNMGYDSKNTTYEDVMHRESPDLLDMIGEAFTNSLPAPISILLNDPKAREAMGTLAEAGLNKTVGFLSEKMGGSKSASMKDVVEYLSYLPANPDAEIDVQNAVKIVFSADTLEQRTKRLGAWDKEYRAKFGDDGYYQMAAFFAKEGVVDAAALSLALRNPKVAAALLPKSAAGVAVSGLMTRMVKALGRASVMGIAGTGVQESMDNYLGFQTNTTNELGMRIGGAFVGEGVARVLATAGKGIIGAGYRAIEGGTKLFGKTGEPVATVGEQVLHEAVNELSPTIRNLLQVTDEGTKIKSIGDEIGTTIGTPDTTTVPVRDIGSQLKTAMQSANTGSLNHIFDMTELEISAAAMSPTSSVKEQILLHGVGNRLIGEKVIKQTAVDNVLDYYFNHGTDTVSMRQGKLKGDTSAFNIKDYFMEPRNQIGVTPDNQYDVLNQANTRQAALLGAQKVAFKGLKEPVRNQVVSLRDKHATMAQKDPNFTVTQMTLDAEGLTPNQQDSYWAVGKLMDFSALLIEQQALKNAVRDGIKTLHGRRNVQVLKHLDGDDAGAVMVRDVEGGEPFAVHQSELADPTQIMGYRKYTVPRRTDNANYIAGTIDTATGKLDITTADAVKSNIEEWATKTDIELKGTGKAAFYFAADSSESSMNFGLGSNSAALMDVLDDAGMAKLKGALSQGGRKDITDEQLAGIRLGFDNVTFGSITSQKVAGKRAVEGLKTVTGEAFKYKPHMDAITQHLMEVAAIGRKDFRLDTVQKFRKEFGSVLPDPHGDWDQPIKNILGQEEKVRRALSVQGYIRRSIFNSTEYGDKWRSGLTHGVNALRTSSALGKAMVDGVEKQPILLDFFKQFRDTTAFGRKAASFAVFAGNLGSFVTQIAQPIAIIAGMKAVTNPTHLMGGMATLVNILGIKAGAGKAVSKEAHAALRALRQSGVIADEALEDMAFVAHGQSSTIYSKGMYTIKQGENLNGALSWVIIREEMKDLAKQGKLQGITKPLTVADIDSPEFIQMVSQKAKQVRLDMTPAGRLGIQTGAGATIFQWMSPLVKTHTLFFSKDLSKAEKFGAALGLGSFYGLSAIPFVGTGLWAMDKVGAAATGGDELDDFTIASDMTNNVAKHLVDEVGDLGGYTKEQKDFFTNAVKKGLVSTLTGNDISLYQKMSMTLFQNSFVSNSTSSPLDQIPMLAVMRKAMLSAGNIAEMLDNLAGVYNMTPEEAEQAGVDVPDAMQKKIELYNFYGEVLDEMGNAIPGIGRITDVLNNNPETRALLNPKRMDEESTGFLTRSNKLIQTGETVSTKQQILVMFGIVPAPVVANREILKGQFDRVKILKDMQQSWIDQYKNANTDISRVRIMRDAFRTASETEQVLMATYQGALSVAVGSSDDRPYRVGSLGKQWMHSFLKIDQEAIAGNRTTSKGESDDIQE